MATTPIGNVVFVLHTHLPWVLGHGKWPHGQDWLHEAIAESYVPLIRMLDRLVAEGIRPKVTIGVTPVLAEMLASPRLRKDFPNYLNGRIELAKADRIEFRSQGARAEARLAGMWAEFFSDVRREFVETYRGDLVAALRRLQAAGHVELITSAATHGYLPLLGRDESVAAQVRAGVGVYRRHFRVAPRGMWLPECAYRPSGMWSRPVGPARAWRRPGLAHVLAANGLVYFFVDTHLIAGGVTHLVPGGAPVGTYEDLVPRPAPARVLKETPFSPYDVHAVAAEPRKPVAVFARDPKSSVQVWSADYGYPGEGTYLEFHKRKGEGGLKYHRVTNRKLGLDAKEGYEPEAAAARAREHADHFLSVVRDTLRGHLEATGRPGVVVAPFDAELFGHWWFEGLQWLEAVLRGLGEEVRTITPSELLRGGAPPSVITLPEGSWGLGGHHHVWLNDDTKWVWDLVYRSEDAFLELAQAARRSRRPAVKPVMAQLAREMLLLESSDWPFLITTWSARDYAEARVRLHHETFEKLLSMAQRAMKGPLAAEDEAWLKTIESRDAPFREIDLGWWTKGP